jgi:hypothetical protein
MMRYSRYALPAIAVDPDRKRCHTLITIAKELHRMSAIQQHIITCYAGSL